jgi:hypothetical protein
MIIPTVGRVLWFYQYVEGYQHKGPLAAIIACVIKEDEVNLMVIGQDGNPRAQINVPLIQGHEDGAVPGCDFCEWMPCQLGQQAKTEDLEEKLKESIGKAKTKKGKKK